MIYSKILSIYLTDGDLRSLARSNVNKFAQLVDPRGYK